MKNDKKEMSVAQVRLLIIIMICVAIMVGFALGRLIIIDPPAGDTEHTTTDIDPEPVVVTIDTPPITIVQATPSPSPEPTPAPTPTPEPDPTIAKIKPDEKNVVIGGSVDAEHGVEELAWQIFTKTNEERVKAGLDELAYAYDLQDIADLRAQESAVKFSHTRPDGTSCHDLVDSWDYYVTGENLIKVDEPIAWADVIVAEWMESEGHRQNILLPDFTKLAVGVYESNGVVYATQIFMG